MLASPLYRLAHLLGSAQLTTSKNHKVEIVRSALTDTAPEAARVKEYLLYALSPYIRFGIAAVPEPAEGRVSLSDPEEAAWLLLTCLKDRKIVGDKARGIVSQVLGGIDDVGVHNGVSKREALRRVVAKDLRAGFDASTVNKAVPGTIPQFDCQLAHSEQPDPAALSYPLWVEPKYDGVRTIAVKKDGKVSMFSRNGHLWENFPELEDYLDAQMPNNFVLDGEVLHQTILGDPGFKLVTKRAKASRGKNADIPIRLSAFDMMPMAMWEAQRCELDYATRREILATAIASMETTPLLQLTPTYRADSPFELNEAYAAWCRAGYEGVIVKTGGGYEFKRSRSWMKLKPMHTADAQVTGIVEGLGKYAGMMGALDCRGELADGRPIEFQVGTGFDDAMRAEPWEAGEWVEVKYQDVSLAEGASTFSLRFPVFVRRRPADASGAKA